ncbi:hypothetical protein D3C87_2161620 [compost metagenome]
MNARLLGDFYKMIFLIFKKLVTCELVRLSTELGKLHIVDLLRGMVEQHHIQIAIVVVVKESGLGAV